MKTAYALFIRNVMIGRQGLSQNVLIDILAKHGAGHIVSYLATGNLTFEHGTKKIQQLKSAIEKDIALVIGRTEPVFIRSIHELRTIDFDAMYAGTRIKNVYEYCISFLPEDCIAPEGLPLLTRRKDAELLRFAGCNVFSTTGKINNRPGSPNKMLEKQLSVRCTTRNINTVKRILEKTK
jgi:uncharacterized protein (DUF1697 family)